LFYNDVLLTYYKGSDGPTSISLYYQHAIVNINKIPASWSSCKIASRSVLVGNSSKSHNKTVAKQPLSKQGCGHIYTTLTPPPVSSAHAPPPVDANTIPPQNSNKKMSDVNQKKKE